MLNTILDVICKIMANKGKPNELRKTYIIYNVMRLLLYLMKHGDGGTWTIDYTLKSGEKYELEIAFKGNKIEE